MSFLGNVYTLNLKYCSNVIDISALGNVHTLNFNHTNVKDVSALGNVHTLYLSSYYRISNNKYVY